LQQFEHHQKQANLQQCSLKISVAPKSVRKMLSGQILPPVRARMHRAVDWPPPHALRPHPVAAPPRTAAAPATGGMAHHHSQQSNYGTLPCHVDMPPLATAAWPTTTDGSQTAMLDGNVPPRRPTAGLCRHCVQRQAPRVVWGLCRYTRRGLFCQLYTQVVLFINDLGRVVLAVKNCFVSQAFHLVNPVID
jgi:hypothetical protein